MRGAAFFDLDRTLLRENSGRLYAAFEYREGRLTARQLVESAFWLLLHHYALLDVEAAYGKAARHWKGVPGQQVKEHALRWFRQDVHTRLTPGGRRALELHRASGYPCILLSNTSEYIAAAASECWQLDGWLANEIPKDAQGRITGTMGTPLCIGAGKVHKAEVYAREHGIDLSQSHFYGDSITDEPMLSRVGHPHVVNPDPGLRRIAKQRGWPIEDWRSPLTSP
jgi:HAD superfamily hydrolase (TIGR01490 family)